MIFSELYSAYYNSVARIIKKILEGGANVQDLQRIVSKNAFDESTLTILPALKNQKWQLVSPDMTTPIKHAPTMPMTEMERRWLKAVMLDARVKLFDVKLPELDGVEPLFTPEDYVIYDKYNDGDPFESEDYIKKFRIILEAIKSHSEIKFEMKNKRGQQNYIRCIPHHIEYSEKDDKFRLITKGSRIVSTVNIARIITVAPYKGDAPLTKNLIREPKYDEMTLKITDERNALERVLLHFAHFEKRLEKTGESSYLLHLKYDLADEMELAIRVLSFGPMVECTAPETLVRNIKSRLLEQIRCNIR